MHMNIKDKELSEKFGFKVMIERKKQNLSQEELAEKAGMHRNSIGYIERAEISPTLDSINSIAKALGLSIQDILDLKF